MGGFSSRGDKLSLLRLGGAIAGSHLQSLAAASLQIYLPFHHADQQLDRPQSEPLYPSPCVWQALFALARSVGWFSLAGLGRCFPLPPTRRSAPFHRIVAPTVTVPFRSDGAGAKDDGSLSFQTTMHDAAPCRRDAVLFFECIIAAQTSLPSFRLRLPPHK